jgi:two-component system, cell cycle sensor histidine kinase and response regulator CckA
MGAMLRRVVGEPIELRLDLDPGLGHVTADPGQLEQVIANLGVNARDAMPRGGTLTITTSNVTGRGVTAAADEGLSAAGPLVSLAVTDTGIGMDDEVRGRLFEPFFTTKELGRGTGLGLATVYGIVRQSGGHIQVRSRPGEGSSFTVYLPRAEAPRPARGALAAAAPVSGGSETVLVAEDEEAVRHLVCRVLRAKGYRVLEARHAEAALDLAAATAEPIDLLVSDLVMPGLGGRALADRLLNLRPALRVLFITGYAPEAVERQGRLPAGHGLLEKPFTADQLAHKVRETLTAR